MISIPLEVNWVIVTRPEVFDPCYVPETLLYRNPELREISMCIKPALAGRRPSNARIYGNPATGKTTAIKLLLEQLRDEPGVAHAYVNCKLEGDKQSIMCRVHEEVTGHSPGQTTSFPRVMRAVFGYLAREKRCLVVVLDDVNYILGVNDVLYVLLRAHEAYPGARVTVLAVASSPRFRLPLEARVASSFTARDVHFRPYAHGELMDILRSRAKLGFSPGALTQGALEMLAEHACKHDLRHGIDLLRRSGEAADEMGGQEVREEHVEAAKGRLLAMEAASLGREYQAIYESLMTGKGMTIRSLYPMVKEEMGSYTTCRRRVREMEQKGLVHGEGKRGRGRTRLFYRVA